MKSKLTWISVLIVLIFLSFQYWITLKGHLTLPSSEWSRPQVLSDKKSNYSMIDSVVAENGYIITLKDLKKQDIFFCQEGFDFCSYKQTITDGITYKNTYNDTQHSYYIQDDHLVRETEGDQSIIAEATNFLVGDRKMIYWNTELQVVVSDLRTMKEEQRYQLNEPVKMAQVVDGDLLTITEDVVKRNYTVYLMREKPEPLFSFKVKALENLQSLQLFSEGEGRYGMLLDIEILANGGRTKVISFAGFDQSAEQNPSFTNLRFYDAETENRIEDIRNPSILNDGKAKKIAFSGRGFDSSGEYATKIFVGDFSEDSILAEAASKKGDSFSRPRLIDADHVLFFSLDGKEKSLTYSSADPKKIEESTKIHDGDLKAAFYKFLTILMNGLVLLLVSFIWFLPAFGVTYGINYLFRRFRSPLSEHSLFILHIIVLFVMQYLTFTKAYQTNSMINRIPYVEDIWQLMLLLAVSVVVSALPILLIRKRVIEDNFNSSMMYVTFLNLLILLIVVGPYFL